ncbi:MAG: RNA methyltransferase [Clostridia bacterium]|nr:RNA methyltransferase [Clostridia bacterium]
MKEPILITSRANPTVKWLASLSERKYRDRERCFLVFGDKLTAEAFAAGAPVTRLILRDDRARDPAVAPLIEAAGETVGIVRLDAACFDKITEEKAPQGVAAVIKYLDFFKYYNIINSDLFSPLTMRGVLLLDAVRDPGNLGAVLRSAAAFGTTDVILSADCADVYHPRTLRASMGALFRLRLWRTDDLPSAVGALCSLGRRVFSAELTDAAVPVSDACLTPADAIVIGNEGHGVSPDVSAACCGSVCLPITDAVESLNASVAASLFVWEMMRPTRRDP